MFRAFQNLPAALPAIGDGRQNGIQTTGELCQEIRRITRQHRLQIPGDQSIIA
ncbi:MAG: hypothetical protein ABSA77_12960 [Thermoguttaceae bacterium]